MVRLDDGMQTNLCPNPPNRGTRPQKGRWHTSQVEREMSAKQAARQHRAEPRGILAKCTMHDVQVYHVEQMSGRPGPDESDLLHVVTKRLGAALHIVLVRVLLGLIGHTTDS